MTFKTIQTIQEVDIYLPYQHWLCACKQNELISIFPISIGCVFANNLVIMNNMNSTYMNVI